jgi:hypothetical protein
MQSKSALQCQSKRRVAEMRRTHQRMHGTLEEMVSRALPAEGTASFLATEAGVQICRLWANVSRAKKRRGEAQAHGCLPWVQMPWRRTFWPLLRALCCLQGKWEVKCCSGAV